MPSYDDKVLLPQIRLYNAASLQSKSACGELENVDILWLCRAYARFGQRLPLMLNGDFAFALYEAASDSYFGARDPLGIKSLYFTKTKAGYQFAANVSDLLKLPTVIKKANRKSMRTMLQQRTVDYTETMYAGIYRLPPGHFMVVENGQERLERYWYPEKIKVDYAISEEEAAQKLKRLFAKAVKKRISNLGETAFEVSGGLDSSSVVSLLCHDESPSAIDSYSMDFPGLKCDEHDYLDSLLEEYPLHHQKVAAHDLDYHQAYSLNHLYSLSPDWPITLTFAMAMPLLERIKSDKKKVVISGQGGDHLFTGTPYALYDLFRRLKFLRLYAELKAHKKPWSAIKGYIIRPLLGEKGSRLVKRLLGKNNPEPAAASADTIDDLSLKAGVKNPAFKDALDMVTMAAHTTVMDGNFFHCAENYFGIEYRHPFFDQELVEFALSLPAEMKYKQRTIKWILRKAMEGILPEKIRKRTDKAEFSELLRQQIEAIDLNQLLDDPCIVKLGLIEQSSINQHRKEYEDKTAKYVTFLWTIINVEYWYRYNFAKELLPQP